MSKVTFEACPRCRSTGHDRSGDNLAHYPDGHKYCFRCGYSIGGVPQLGHMAARINQPVPKGLGEATVKIPDSVQFAIEDEEAKQWMARYNLTENSQIDFEILWYPEKRELIFPIYTNDGRLMAYQARNFSGRGPKWRTEGKIHEHPIVYAGIEDANLGYIVLVEDVVSAIRVSDHIDTMPLFGTHLNPSRTAWLAQRYRNVIFWLDHDALSLARKYSTQFQIYPEVSTHIIETLQDPKAYTHDEIAELVSVVVGSEVPPPASDGDAHDSEDDIPY